MMSACLINKCGTVYGLDVGTDAAMGSDYVAQNMCGVVSGTMMDYPAGSDYENNNSVNQSMISSHTISMPRSFVYDRWIRLNFQLIT